ncbi:MAG: hypothetical protein SFW08_09890 [Gemmatimonadaceae bacterium]|nr:hypothetical protein [Gemmatimonadaceae bacterium]
MSHERRFSDDEIARILEAAAQESAERAVDAGADVEARGLTLSQLKAVASEAGLDPAALERAAAAVARGDHRGTMIRRSFGLPVAVARTVPLGRQVSDAAWDRMVVRLREVFDAPGRLIREGTLREWRNGNLRVVLEPTPQGHRLRFSTRRGDSSVIPALGALLLLVAILLSSAFVAAGGEGAPWWSPALLGVMGSVALLRNLVVLPRWARRRQEQIESLGRELDELSAETDQQTP